MRRQFLVPSYVPLLLLLLGAWMLRPSHSADPRKPHPHKGLLEPYELKPPKMSLDGAALAKLKKGQPVKKQINSAGKSGGRGIVVQDVHAPVSVVMGRILDFGNYPKMVPNVAQCGHYATKKLINGDFELKTRYVLSVLGVKLEYYVRHVHRPSVNTLVWTLDYDRHSDFDDCAGYWSVAPLDGKNGEWSRVFYSIDLRIPSWIPGFVVNILNTQALTSATAWVKTQSEKTFAPTLKAKAAQQAAAATAAAGAAAAGGKVSSGHRRRYGGGDMWEGFIEEFSDLLDTKKYAAQVAARARRREEKAKAKAQKAQRKEKKAGQQQGQGQGQGRREGKGGGAASEQDDARRLLVFLWVAVLAYGLLQLWRDLEEEEQDKPALLDKPATAPAGAGGALPPPPPPSSLSSSS